ncbi:hypothetical protein Afil01_27460 [Actinorhabdospora filicis]|uniref:Nucleic acid/nucleotide deaminase of polymorphic system toxin n=1 Tax=Actinorhabdospora filicis TaxID=1785913 RepID=A0A9W6SIZ7_9ACTN|nr:DddA-like double-stranded DNA deaminase toxin [Actinorhabdospora filicis]GLZ77939.1 hypothetical protein Afil01_27460 [Actinorhabdospora filicis]
MGALADVIAALEAVRAAIGAAREHARAGAEKFGESYEHLSTAFDGSGNSAATASLAGMTAAADSLAEADAHAAAALMTLGEYVEVVKGNGPGGGSSASAASGGSASEAPGGAYDAEGTWRGLPAFPPKPPRHTHGSATGKDGETVPVVSGEKTPDGQTHDWRYVDGVKLARRLGLVPAKGKPNVASDVELKWALQMRRDGITDSQVTINHPDGPCRGALSCDQLLPIWLREDSRLTVHWRDADGAMRSKTYVGRPDHD